MALVTDNACPNFDSDPGVSTLVFIARCRGSVRIAHYAATERFPVAKIEETTPPSHQLPDITEAGRRCLYCGK
jgi:hypothetical protein